MDKDYTLDDFRKHFQSIQKMGTKDMISRMPGSAAMIPEGKDPDAAFQRVERMIDAMTDAERLNPDRIDAEARQRIATAAGTEPQEVEQFLSQFAELRALMRRMADMNLWERLKLMAGVTQIPPPPEP